MSFQNSAQHAQRRSPSCWDSLVTLFFDHLSKLYCSHTALLLVHRAQQAGATSKPKDLQLVTSVLIPTRLPWSCLNVIFYWEYSWPPYFPTFFIILPYIFSPKCLSPSDIYILLFLLLLFIACFPLLQYKLQEGRHFWLFHPFYF